MYYHFITVIKGDNKVKTIGTPRKSADKPFLAARVPASLNDALEADTKSTGENKTDALIIALAAYLGWSEDKKPKTSSSDRLSQLEERVRELEETVYKPRQTSLLEISSSRPKTTSPVIKTDNVEDNITSEEKFLTHRQIANMTGLNYNTVKAKPSQERGRTVEWEGRTFTPIKGKTGWKWVEDS